jgi:hypothetical protein
MNQRFFKRLLLIVFCVVSMSVHASKTRILSLDGGGVRGVVTLELMRQLEKDSGIHFHNDFDVFAGTSTGSVIAVLLACGVSVDHILNDYQKMSSDVFSDGNSIHLFHPKYGRDKLKKSLKKILSSHGIDENIFVRDLPKKVVITTVTLDDEAEKRWRMEFIENFSGDKGNIKVVDAILESTAAPTYFPSEHGHVDGGMGMKDPSLAALMFAYSPDKDNLKDISLLSLGTGFTQKYIKGNEDWGISQWMGSGSKHSDSQPLLHMVLDVEGQIPEQVAEKLLGSRYKRIDFELESDVALDDYKHISKLIKTTDHFIKNDSSQWIQDCKWVSENAH